MNASILMVSLLIVVVLAILWLGERRIALKYSLKYSYFAGISVWSRWLPVVATGIYLAVLTLNLTSGVASSGNALSFGGFFSTAEIIVLFLLGPLFLTGVGNLLAGATVFYTLERVLFAASHHTSGASYSVLAANPGASLALDLIIGTATIIAVLGDKMPWHLQGHAGLVAARLRTVLLWTVATSALVALLTGLAKIFAFNHWLVASFGFMIPTALTMALLAVLVVGWMSVLLGYSRHMTMPFLCLPTLLVVAYLTSWPGHILIVPFALCFALSLSAADRRLNAGRRGVGIRTTVLPAGG